VEQQMNIPKFAGFENRYLCRHLNSKLVILFSSRFVAAFLEGDAFQSISIRDELSRLRVAQCDEQHPHSTFALQEILETSPTFRNYFGHVQEARETYLYLAHLIESERREGQRFIDLMTIPVIQRIVYDCDHEHTIAATQHIVDFHEDCLRDISVPIGTYIWHGGH
jgi:hypothetical protein